MASNCIKIVGGCLVEIIREDECGLPLIGVDNPNNAIRTTGLIQVDLTPDIDNGTDIFQRSMCGDICINEKDSPILKGFNGKMKLCAIDPALLNIVLGVTPLLDPDDDAVTIGGRMKGESHSITNTFHMKVWGKPAKGCTDDNKPWVVFAFPRIENPTLSSTITFANKQLQAWEINFYAREGHADFVDPTGVFSSDELSDDLWAWKSVDDVPEASACGEFLSV